MSNTIAEEHSETIREAFPWVPLLAGRLSRSGIKPISGPMMYVASDYSGSSRASPFYVVSIGLFDMAASMEWQQKRLSVRKQYLRDLRKISFKNMNDVQRRAALVPFLFAAEHLPGACVTFAIDKRVKNFGSCEGFLEGCFERGMLTARWKRDPFAKMCTVTHLVAVLCALLSHEGQDICWISDVDDLAASRAHAEDTTMMVSRFSSMHTMHKLGDVYFGTTDIDQADRMDEDFCAIPDLAAGAVAEVYAGMQKRFGRIPTIPIVIDFALSRKTEIIWDWLFSRHGLMQKIVCWVQPSSVKGQLQISIMTNKERWENVII